MKVILIITIVVLQNWNSFSQCPCNEIQPDSALAIFENVMSVELISKSKNNRRFDKNQSFPKGIINEFEIFGVLKGDYQKGDTIRCLTGNGKEDNGYIFEIGGKYILFYEKYIDNCSPTTYYTNELSYKLQNILNPNLPTLPPPSLRYSSKLYKYESNGNYYSSGLRAEIINENRSQLINILNSKIEDIGGISKNSLITIILNDENQVINSRVISIRQKNNKIGVISNKLKEFIEQNMKFRTKDENCLISNSNWFYRYE